VSGTDPISIHTLGPDDVALLPALNRVFGEAFEEPRTYGDAPPGTDYLRSLLGSESFIAVVALDADEVVGGLTAYELRKAEQKRSEVFIYDLAVAEPYRRRGVATALIERTRAIAAERGAWVVFLQADVGDEPAISLYSKLGKREDAIQFDIPVERP